MEFNSSVMGKTGLLYISIIILYFIYACQAYPWQLELQIKDGQFIDEAVPEEYIYQLEVSTPVEDLSYSELWQLRQKMAQKLHLSPTRILFDKASSFGHTVGMVFVHPDISPSSPIHSRQLILTANLGLPQQAKFSPFIVKRDQSALLDLAASTGYELVWLPYVMATVLGLFMIGATAFIIWYCVRRYNTTKSPAKPTEAPQQICLYPATKPDVYNATLIQPSLPPLTTSKSPSPTGYSSPATYSSSSQSGTPLNGTPVHTPPMRIRRGLLERRGSNASLTIDLNLERTSHDQKWGSPPKESSAEEYLLSASHRLSRKDLRNSVRNVRALYEEFWEIPMNHPDKVEVPGSGMKNRYRTIIPNEGTRVKLPEIDNDPLTSYINANYIRGFNSQPHAYIAMQGPMSNTVLDFWRLVWHEKAPIVVMITKLKEKNRTKCESYLPESYGTYGDLHVYIQSISEKDGFILRNILIKCGEEEHNVLHYWYTAWPDHKAPNTARQLLDLVKTVHIQRHIAKGPVVIHCSAGIGRTGCFIATSIGIQMLNKENMVDVLSIVCNMRLDRGGMVQTNEQYEFVHQALCIYEQEMDGL